MTNAWLRKLSVGTGWKDRRFEVDVELYSDKPTMLAAALADFGEQADGTEAMTHCYTDGSEPHALIQFAIDDFTPRIVAHEAAHAAVHLTGMLTTSLPAGDDEMIPWFTGELTSAILELHS